MPPHCPKSRRSRLLGETAARPSEYSPDGLENVAALAGDRAGRELGRVKVRRSAPPSDLEAKVAQLERELAESREQQTVTAEILRVIASSTTELQAVLDAITASAT